MTGVEVDPQRSPRGSRQSFSGRDYGEEPEYSSSRIRRQSSKQKTSKLKRQCCTIAIALLIAVILIGGALAGYHYYFHARGRRHNDPFLVFNYLSCDNFFNSRPDYLFQKKPTKLQLLPLLQPPSRLQV